MASRTIIRIALLQVLLIVSGFFCLGVVMKFGGYSIPEFREYYRWNPVSVFLRHHSLLLLLLPAAWTTYALISERRQYGIWSVFASQVAALVLLASIITAYSYASLRPYTIPLMIGRPAKARIVGALLALGMLFSGTAVAAEIPRSVRATSFYGINEDPLWNYKPEERARCFELLRASGAGAIRLPIRWRVVQPERERFDFNGIDAVLKEIPADVEILATLMSVPAWANGVDEKNVEGWPDVYPPKDLADWRKFVTTVVSRYRDRVHHWEILNEQNGIDFYRPHPDAKGYTALLRTAYEAAKEADPKCTVVLGGLQMNGIIPNPWSPVKVPDFLDALYKAGAAPYFDVCNIHPYVLPGEGAGHMMKLIGDTLALMDKHGDAKKPVWLTEVGCGATSRDAEKEQAELLKSTYRLAAAEPRIQRVYWFLLRDTAKDILGPESSMGLYDFSGRPKAAAAEFRRLAEDARSAASKE